ncbi:MAG: hypothetical protein QNJ69_02145 [Gammaproteobacteria bacterium]|nr:hypothetical protein [Gammaproteobacteria bacterium]
MQNRYSGDIGDYSKFLLLRKLFAEDRHRIGLVWYLYPDESHTNDGRHIDYLRQQDFADCDPDLIAGLTRVIDNQRAIQALESAELLPNQPIYFSEPLDFHLRYPRQTVEHKQHRDAARSRWLERAIEAIRQCNVVMLDPDNGLQVSSCDKTHQARAGKYAFYHEVENFYRDKYVCVVYQHLHRQSTHRAQIKQRAQELKTRVPGVAQVFALRYAPYTPRAYFILASSQAVCQIRDSLQQFSAGICGLGWDSYVEA